MTKSEFIELIEAAKPDISGHARELAEKSGLSLNKYHMYLKGQAPDERIRKVIAKVVLEFLRSKNQNIAELLSRNILQLEPAT